MHFRELAAAAGLLLVLVVAGPLAVDRLAVRDLRLLGVHLDAEAGLEPLPDDVEVKLADAADDEFVRLRVVRHLHGRVFRRRSCAARPRSSARRRGSSARRPARTSASGTSAAAAAARGSCRRSCRRSPAPRPSRWRRCRPARPRESARCSCPGLRAGARSRSVWPLRRFTTLWLCWSLPAITRMKLRCPTNLSLTTLNTCATNSSCSVGSSWCVVPFGPTCRPASRLLREARRQAVSAQRVEQFLDALVLLGRRAEDRDERAGVQRLGDVRFQFRDRDIALRVRYFSSQRFVALDHRVDELRARGR